MSEMHYANAVCAAINMNQASYPPRVEEDPPAVVNIVDVATELDAAPPRDMGFVAQTPNA